MIVGIVCHPDAKDEIIPILEHVHSTAKLYDLEGNMLWPQLMSHEEVKQRYTEQYPTILPALQEKLDSQDH